MSEKNLKDYINEGRTKVFNDYRSYARSLNEEDAYGGEGFGGSSSDDTYGSDTFKREDDQPVPEAARLPDGRAGQAFVRAGNRYGVDPRLLVGIATIESGAGEHMKLAYNPFNWGVHRGQTFSSWGQALNTVAKGLRKNYIAAGLTTPEQIVSKYAPASDNNDEGNWASVVVRRDGPARRPARCRWRCCRCPEDECDEDCRDHRPGAWSGWAGVHDAGV